VVYTPQQILDHKPVDVGAEPLPGKVSYRGVSRASQTDLLRSSPPLEVEAPIAEPTAARRSLSLAELVTLAVAAIVGIVGLVSLASGHLGHATLPIIAVVSSLVVVVAALVIWRFDRPKVRLDIPGLIPVTAGLVLAAIMMFPGFQYGTGDRDPGAYIEHAVAISRTHSIDFFDELGAARLTGGLQGPNTSPGGPTEAWPALWDKPGGPPGTIFPQFYHLWPALLATAKDVGGFTGLFNAVSLLGVIAVGLAVAVARRIAGLPAAWLTAALLPTNMLEVWQAKYPSAEIFGQMLFMGTMLGVILAIQMGWRTAAATAGVMLSLSYLERADGIVLVLIGWATMCALVAARRFDRRAAWFAGGLLVLLPYGFYQAYGLASYYTEANGVPSIATVVAVMVGLALVAVLIAWQRRAIAAVLAWGAERRTQLWLGTTFVVVCGSLMVLGGLRPRLFGADYTMVAGVRQRTYDEASLIRLSWFFTLPGLALMLAGIGFVAWTRWRLDRWLVALPAAGLLTLYCYHVRNSPYLMWATRRFVTSVVPSMVLLIGCGVTLGFILVRRFIHRGVGVVAVAAAIVALTVFNLSESWPLRSHNENGGAVEVEKQVAALAGNQQGVFLWEQSTYCCAAPWELFGGPVFAIANQPSALLPTTHVPQVLAGYVDHFAGSGRPVFYVADRNGVPPRTPGVTSTKVAQFVGVLPHWAETFDSRPKTTQNYPYSMTVYRLTAG
jgi:hypothetical protein